MHEKTIIYAALILLIATASGNTQSARINLLERQGPPGGFVNIPVTVSNAERLAGLEFALRYDNSILDFIEANTTSLTAGFSVLSSVQNGKVAVSMARATGLEVSNGTLLELRFRIQSTAQIGAITDIFWDNVGLFDEQAQPMIYETRDGVIKISEFSVFPNPFTPNNDGFNDKLNFVVPDSIVSQITVKIYGVKGSMIRSFTTSDVPTLQWDGRDENGNPLQPGLYYYLLLKSSDPIHKGTVTLMR